MAETNVDTASDNTELQGKKDAIRDLLKGFKKDHPESVAGFATDPDVAASLNYDKIASGIPQFDEIADGGVPEGKFTILTGKAGSGKSTFGYQLIAHDQQQDADGIWVIADVENSYDPAWIKTLGVDEERIVLLETEIMEDILQKVIDLSKTKCIRGVLVDSIGALLPRAEVEAPASTATAKPKTRTLRQENVAVVNRKIGQFYRAANVAMTQANVAIILISHVYTDINSMGRGERLITKGGNATQHWAHLRVGFRRVYDVDKEVMVTMPDGRQKKVTSGFDAAIKIEKTKQGVHEGHEVYIPFTYGIGFDSKACTINAAVAKGVIKQAGAWFRSELLPDGKIQGKKSLHQFFLNDDKLYGQLLNDVILACTEGQDDADGTAGIDFSGPTD